jgi:hypothetical protein
LGDGIVELYIHTKDVRGRENYHVQNYEPPLENFIDIDTTNKPEFESLQEIREKLIF